MRGVAPVSCSASSQTSGISCCRHLWAGVTRAAAKRAAHGRAWAALRQRNGAPLPGRPGGDQRVDGDRRDTDGQARAAVDRPRSARG